MDIIETTLFGTVETYWCEFYPPTHVVQFNFKRDSRVPFVNRPDIGIYPYDYIDIGNNFPFAVALWKIKQ